MVYTISEKPDSNNRVAGSFLKNEHTYIKNRSKHRIKIIIAESESESIYAASKLYQYKKNKGINHKA